MNTQYDKLFMVLDRQHGITLIQSEMDEIVAACRPFYAAEIEDLNADIRELRGLAFRLQAQYEKEARQAVNYTAEIEDLKFELDKTKVEVRQLLDALAKCGAYDRQDIMSKIDTILEKYDRK